MSVGQSYFRKLILGNDPPFILSHSQFKRILLTGQLSLLTALVCLFYAVFDFINGVYAYWPYQTLCGILSIISFILNRKRFFRMAKLCLSLCVNITLFVFAISEPHSAGIYAIYIPICLGSLAAFGFEERAWAIATISFSVFLGISSLAIEGKFAPPLPGDALYDHLNFAINMIISGVVSILISYFLITVNHHSESRLIDNEQLLLSKNKELTKLNAELDRFVYSSSHDLRAPLSSVLGLVNLIEMSKDLNEVKSFAPLMRKRIDDLDKFIRKISDYSRNNRLVVQVEEVNIKRVVYDVLESLQFFPGSEKMDIKVDIPDVLISKTDPIRLKMVISNLISNSFKYQDPSKSQSYVQIQANKNAHGLVLQVADNGIGIPINALPRIFEMFFQAHNNSEGSGLGLFIVKETVEKLGGSIEAESTSGLGSRFKIVLPA